MLATIPGYLELVETAPRLDKPKLLLNERPYTEELDEEQVCFLSYKHTVDVYISNCCSSIVISTDNETRGLMFSGTFWGLRNTRSDNSLGGLGYIVQATGTRCSTMCCLCSCSSNFLKSKLQQASFIVLLHFTTYMNI